MNKDNHEEFLRSENKRLERELTTSKSKLSAAEAQAELYHQHFFNERQDHVSTRDWNRTMIWVIIFMSIVLCILLKHNWDTHKLLDGYRNAEVARVTDNNSDSVFIIKAKP